VFDSKVVLYKTCDVGDICFVGYNKIVCLIVFVIKSVRYWDIHVVEIRLQELIFISI